MLKPHQRKEKMKNAFNYLKNERGVDMIMDYYITSEYVEATCKKGDDVIVFNVYDDGRITER
jgi:hypothetical protein